MASTKFYLDTRRKSPDGKSILKISICKKGATAYINTGISLLPSQWDKLREKVIGHPHQAIININIQQQKTHLDALLYRLTMDGKLAGMTSSQIKTVLLDMMSPDGATRIPKNGFWGFYERCLATKRGRTREMYDYTLKRVRNFVGAAGLRKLTFEDITKEWLEKFDIFLETEGSSCNTRSIHFRNIRSVFNDALDEGITDAYPFRRFRIRTVKTPKRSLTLQELRTLFDYPIDPMFRKYLDAFKLIFYFIGINVVDLADLTEVKDGRIEFRRAKTNRLYSIKVEPEAAEIINRYRGREKLLDIRDHYINHKDYLHRLNENLQRIGPVVYGPRGTRTYHPLFPKLTSYWARHTWATIAASLDIPKETIAAALGHGGNTVTDIYIDFDRQKIDEANRRVLDFVLYGRL